jgi:hypothetical protein
MRKPALIASIFLCVVLTLSLAIANASRPSAPSTSIHLPPAVFSAMNKINADHIRADVRFLSHDLLEGRGTGQRGGDLAAEYIATQFQLAGLKGAGDHASFFQRTTACG